MNDEQTDIQKKRAAWLAEHPFKGLTFSEMCGLNEEFNRLFPLTPEERAERTRSMVDVEFVL